MASEKSASARRPGLGMFMASLLGGGVIAGAAIAVFESFGARLPAEGAALGALFVGALAMLWSRGWWARVDEGVREAHKTAWYWGGSVGSVIVSGLAAFLLFDRSGASLERFAMATGDGGLILTGIVVALGLQLIGYGVFWAGWWFTRSR